MPFQHLWCGTINQLRAFLPAAPIARPLLPNPAMAGEIRRSRCYPNTKVEDACKVATILQDFQAGKSKDEEIQGYALSWDRILNDWGARFPGRQDWTVYLEVLTSPNPPSVPPPLRIDALFFNQSTGEFHAYETFGLGNRSRTRAAAQVEIKDKADAVCRQYNIPNLNCTGTTALGI